jgi:lipoprotein-anchoring transpeptidase ErfK/SrfK
MQVIKWAKIVYEGWKYFWVRFNPFISCQLTYFDLKGILSDMSFPKKPLSRRDFLKLAGLSAGALVIRPPTTRWNIPVATSILALPDFPKSDLLGRNCTSDTNLQWGGTVPIMTRPDVSSSKVRDAHRDEVFAWTREVSAENINFNLPNQRWVETPEGYIWSPYLQPCRNLPNTPLAVLPAGTQGFWAEVTIPYVDLILDNPAPVSGWMRDHVTYDLQARLYYSQVMWIDQVRSSDSGTVQYHVYDRYGDPGDRFWAEGAAFRPLTQEDISPINPEVDPATKKVIVNLNYQTLSCMEGDKEVYFCRVSTGLQEGSTPVGEHAIWRKLISVRMEANVAGASYSLPGMSWSTFFVGDGVAIHAATSHNDFGTEKSHGCVNCRPEDAKWIFRWSQPAVPIEPGDLTITDWQSGSTHVFVVDTF